MASCWLWYAFGHAKNKQLLLDNQHIPLKIKEKMQKSLMNVDNLPKEFTIPQDYIPNTLDAVGSQETWQQMEKTFMDPLFSPLMAEDLSGLPKSLVITVEHDVLRDEGAWYAHRLVEANVTTVHKHYTNGFHGILSFSGLYESDAYMNDITSFIREYV